MKKPSKTKGPEPTEEVRAPKRETVSATPNDPKDMCAQPVVDGGHDCGVGHWQGDGTDIRFVKA